MLLTTNELYEAFRVSYTQFRDNPDDHSSLDETFADIDGSALAKTHEFAGIIQALRQTK